MKNQKSRSGRKAKPAIQARRARRLAPARKRRPRKTKTPGKTPISGGQTRKHKAASGNAPKPAPTRVKRARKPAASERAPKKGAGPPLARGVTPITLSVEQPLAEISERFEKAVAASDPKPAGDGIARTRPPLKIPPILFEGDEPSPLPAARRGGKSVSGTLQPGEQAGSAAGGLPEAYGRQKLLLLTRDPHWLYAYWDLTREQRQRYNALAASHHLVVRVYLDKIESKPVTELHVHPDSQFCFIHVQRAGVKYVAELGYYGTLRQWVTITASNVAAVPPDAAAEDKTVQFATVGRDRQSPRVARPAGRGVPNRLLPLDGVEKLQAAGDSRGQAPVPVSSGRWTSAREFALAELVSVWGVRKNGPSSADLAEISPAGPAQLEFEALPGAAPAISSPLGGEAEALSSPLMGQPQRQEGFWLSVNAELVVYGATEPDAVVMIGGRPIRIRPDGTFSYRFALPDGNYELPVCALSTHGDQRQAELEFSRLTRYEGEVGEHAQDPNLRVPSAENVD